MAAIDQMCFSGETSCHFQPNMLKPNICRECMKDISKHDRNVVTNEDVVKALEHSQKGEKVPSLILEKSDLHGKLFLGGFKAVLNQDFLINEQVKLVINTVGDGLFHVFGKKLQNAYTGALSNNNISSLYVQWIDSTTYDISDDDLEKVLRHIHENLKDGGSVLVHCAQGKSRSTTAVVAYVMTIMEMTSQNALAYVKERRKMAEPNSHFMVKLHEYEMSELISNLRKEFTS